MVKSWEEFILKRGLLHKSKLEDFKSFLVDQNIQYRNGKSDYQVLQIEVNGRFYPIYDRYSGDHFTTQRELFPLIRTYLRVKK